MDPPKVSVVVPNYNHERFLAQRIDTVLGQTFKDLELILLDDRSTDASRSVLQRYARLPNATLVVNDANSGSTFKQWNKGVRLARGPYVWLAESDDFADPRFLERHVDALDRHPSATLAYCRSHRVSTDGRLDGFADAYLADLDPSRWASDFDADGRDECARYLCCRNTVPNASAVLFRRSAYLRAGGADESMRLCGDWKLWASLALAGRIVYSADPLNYYRFHPGTVRRSSARTGLEALESLRVSRWIGARVRIPAAIVPRRRSALRGHWEAALVDPGVPLARRAAILIAAWRIDPGTPRQVARLFRHRGPLLRAARGQP